jgi:dTDP-4-amino-4,6-dideoxy-D-galactose acyltransferase
MTDVGMGAARAPRQVQAPPCRLLAWDTEFWGERIARVETRTVTSESLRTIDDWCLDQGVACVYLLLDAADPTSTLAAERAGFFFTDVRVTFEADLGARRSWTGHVGLRSARADDRDRLAHLARISHGVTRFFHDPHFDNERCGELYAQWMLSSLDGGADTIIVADADGVAAGYVTCEVEKDGELGRIGLIAVEPSSQGRGLGLALCEAAFDWFAGAGATRAEVVTQGRNVAAQRVFQRAGARTVATELWFHKWYVPVRATSPGEPLGG